MCWGRGSNAPVPPPDKIMGADVNQSQMGTAAQVAQVVKAEALSLPFILCSDAGPYDGAEQLGADHV